MDRPLFVPLRAEWFDAFARGEKRIEWRAYGPRWNYVTATPGRRVTLSRGYSGARLYGQVERSERVAMADAPAALRDLYPHASHLCAIHVVLD